MTDHLLHTACHDWHIAHGGRMVDFAGWEMPVQYSSIVAEHQAVRTAAGLFDIAHMGRLRFTGPDTLRFLNHLVTNDVRQLDVGQIQYALVVNDEGGTLDDVLVYRMADFHLMVVNASNRTKIVDWIAAHQSGFDVHVEDLTTTQFMLALQGPKAEEILNRLVDIDLKQIGYYRGAGAHLLDDSVIVSRTGYTGEDGFEVILGVEHAVAVWERLLAEGADVGVLPAGLGCRDTLRLEAAMPLYGHELDEQTDPLTAGLGFAVKLDKRDFIGRAALEQIKAKPNRPRRVGLQLDGRRIAREGALVFVGDRQIGRVTSGTFAPTLEKSIAMAYVSPESVQVGNTVEIDIRGSRERATIVKLPFYKRP
jgi:aminomethyltransferase